MSLSNKEKQEYAWMLFKDGTLTQKAIAEKLKVREATITEWKEKGEWEKKRRSLLNTREEILADLYHIMEDTKNTIKKDGGKISPKDADAVLKWSTAIKNMETDLAISEVYEVGKRFIQHVQRIDFERAKEIVDLYHSFIQECLKNKA